MEKICAQKTVSGNFKAQAQIFMKKWKNKIILAVLLLAIACLPVAAFLFFLTDIGPIWPGKNDINAAKNALEKAQSGLASRIKEVSLIQQ